MVPITSILLGKQNEAVGIVDAGVAAGVGEHDEGEQAGHVGVAGQESPEHASQVEGPVDQVAADQLGTGGGGVPGGEDEMHDVEHGVEAGRSSGGGTR
jgi:hypothetical protein